MLTSSVDYEKLLVKLAKSEKDNANLKKELEDSKAQILFLAEQKAVVEKNMASLFATAVNDLKRKDKQIIDLTMKANGISKG
jgi:hypothetical protein